MPSRSIPFPVVDGRELRAAIGMLRVDMVCACHCDCHAGRCNRSISMETLDCDRECRASGYLSAGCLLETRPEVTTAEGGSHV